MALTFRKSLTDEVQRLTEISKAAFDTDVDVGGTEPGGPPDYDNADFYRDMLDKGNLYTLTADDEVVGGAVVFSPRPKLLGVGRIFVAPEHFRKGYGIAIMENIEGLRPDTEQLFLDTPIWNVRTNRFYAKCGYTEYKRDMEFIYYAKFLNR